jgi:hypothetical protein
VNGYPAVSYYDINNGKLKFVRATNASGTTWGTPMRPVSNIEFFGNYTSMISAGTGAAIAYYSSEHFLPFFVTSLDFALPVTFTHFAARWKNTAVQLDWQVADESGIGRYVIERSADGINFSTLTAITATNTHGIHSYNYQDESPLPGTNYYRIRIEEAAGGVRYSSIVTLKAGNNATQYVNVYPNPVKNNTLQFEASLPAGVYKIQVMNSAGVEVMKTVYQHSGGTVVQALPISQITNGIYHLIINGNKARITASFVR